MPESLSLAGAPSIPAATVSAVAAILAEERLLSHLPACRLARSTVEAEVPPGTPLPAAHAGWQPGHFPRLASLPPLPDQPIGAVTPGGVVRVAVECVVRLSGGMSSYYGFEGHFVSLLVSLPERRIWDARTEEAR